MMTFRKLSAASAGKLLRAYFTEHNPETEYDPSRVPGKRLDSGGRLTAYYTGRDSRRLALRHVAGYRSGPRH
jgi:hypothetical protein